ncbi:MAG: thioredoxin domain-containing protein [Mongoliibacter sp.]|uniref:thioredoxin domain-containing protein n=1 Tax=Mongoliibacter sp. TaxID=2022438 RepID=UPI0012F118F4|nr:thioredoxin domain-containing protein [Mongoliibacter sp.]TVP49668.1 MAG: thioredoxin domain-containing protein [Mongoliibacter sp.]
MNRLKNAQSPYLLQHANNPVDWFPWGEEALQKSKKENKPIIVSIGYSACHWCHVMEKESFEDEATAGIMNQYFVCIKIDREERPDLDNIYMDAIQAMGLQGGWPLNVFLMPDQRPFYGGTYFPNKQWKALLQNIGEAYEKHFEQLMESAEGFGKSLQTSEFDKYGLAHDELQLSKLELELIVKKLEDQFDPEWGGMNRKPKFPMPAIWSFLLEYAQVKRDDTLLHKVFFTLEKMGMGGIYDHLRGGFARYAVDGEWFAPHFEKMLYDNGQLLELYASAFAITGDDFFKEKVVETVAWLKHEMLHEEGGFYAAQDADSEGVEGKFYTWTYKELESHVGEDMDWLRKLYNLKYPGNWEEGVNILFQTKAYDELSSEEGLTKNAYIERLNKLKTKLLTVRNQRIYPGLDDKILSGWNGLMISGLVKAYLSGACPEALSLAVKNGEFILRKMHDSGQLYRSYKNGKAYTPSFLEDYAALIRACIDLYQATFEVKWLNHAKALTDKVIDDFYDKEDGFFFFNNPRAEKLIANKKELFDNVIPASNSMMAKNLQDLSLFYYHDPYAEISQKMLGAIRKLIVQEPGFLCNWASLYLSALLPKAEIAIVGKGALDKARALQSQVHTGIVVAASESVNENIPLLFQKRADKEGNALIYVCVNKACQQPVSSVSDAIKQIPDLS